MSFPIPGFDNSWKLPFFGTVINYHTGPNLAPGQLDVLVMGNRTSAGNLVLDSEIRQVFDRTTINAAGGEGSEVSLMALAALAAQPNVNLYMMAVTEAAGGAAATVTILLGGAASAAGTLLFYIKGKQISVSYASGAALDTIGAAIVTAVGNLADNPFTAAYNSGTKTVTLTSRNVGVRTKDWIIYQDTSGASGVTSTLTGSASVNTVGNVTGVRAGVAGGTGADDITAAVAASAFTAKRWARIACAENDTTNAPLLKAAMAAQAAVTKQFYDMACFGFNGTQADTITLSQTTLNDPLSEVFTCRNCETHPALIASGWAATRAAVEAGTYVPDYDGYDCSKWIAPQRFPSDSWLSSEANALLNAGATPISTVNNVATCARAITTYCLNGSAQDERCLDVGDAVVPQQLALDLLAAYQDWRQKNPRVEADPDIANGEPYPPAGVGTPSDWKNTKVLPLLADYRDAGWIKDTFSGSSPEYPVAYDFNETTGEIEGAITIVSLRVQHKMATTVNQAAA